MRRNITKVRELRFDKEYRQQSPRSERRHAAHGDRL